MKKGLLLIIAICCLAVVACKKSGIAPGLVGKWELRHMYGGLAGFDSTYTAGNGNIYQFNSDSTFKHYRRGQLDAQGVFHIKKFDLEGHTSLTISFNDNDYSDYFSINGSKMTIGTTATDGIAIDYQKISD